MKALTWLWGKMKGTKQGRELKLGLYLFALGWAIATVVVYVIVKCDRGHWLELFNGATWPAQFLEPTRSTAPHALGNFWFFLFYLVVAFRSLVNLGVVLGGAYVLYTMSTTVELAKEWFMSKLDSVLTTRDTALAAFLIHQMKTKHLEVVPEMKQSIYDAARAFQHSTAGQSFMKTFQADREKTLRELGISPD